MTNKPSTTKKLDDGQPLVEVAGFAPLKPAEFKPPTTDAAILQGNIGIA